MIAVSHSNITLMSGANDPQQRSPLFGQIEPDLQTTVCGSGLKMSAINLKSVD